MSKKLDTGPKLVAPDGRPIKDGKVALDAAANVFEGFVTMTLYDDAIAGKGTCAHCLGPIEGVLKFPRGYKVGDDPDRIADARKQLCAKLKREHYCISRLDKDKLPAAEFLKRFE